MRKLILTTALLMAAGVAPAFADCKGHFAAIGVPLLSGIDYVTWDSFAKVDKGTALSRIAKRLRADGYDGVQVSKSRGVVTATQEMSGSGRTQTLRFVASKSGNGTRVDVTFSVRAGQIASNGVVRRELCKLIGAAAG